LTRTRIWLLQPRADVLARVAHPWVPPYEKTFAVVVRAMDEMRARELARGVSLRPEYTDCAPLLQRGQPGVILVDRWEG
jgi:hypothetical protein